MLDIVKKGYARGAEQLYLFCSGRPQASCREGLAQAGHEALVLFGSECAYRTLQIGFISMQLVFLGNGHRAEKEQEEACASKARELVRLSQVGIANESDQVS